MQYSSGRRNTFGSAGAASASSSVTAASSRLSALPSHRKSTRGAYSSSPSTGSTYISPARYSSTYNSTSSSRPISSSATRYSRFSTSSAPAEPAGSRFRTSRYDSHYSNYGASSPRRSSDIGSDSRYTSPGAGSVSTRPYVTASSGVSTSRESSLSKSWPSPARNLGSTAVSLPRYDASVRSSSSTVASTVAARQRRSPVVGAGSVPALPSSNYSGIESRRGSLDLARTPSSSTLHSQTSRRFLGSGSGALDGNFSAGRAESLYRPSSKYTTSGSSRFLTSGTSAGKHYDLLDTVGASSNRRVSVLSTSSSARGMSRSPVRTTSPSPGPTGKSLWNKHYGALSARWAEQTGATLSSTANGKNQYSYRPVSLRKMSNGAVSDGSVDVSSTQSNTSYTRRSRRKRKEESDGYDSSSSSNGEGDKNAKTKTDSNNTLTKTPTRSKRTTANGASGTGSFRRTRASNIAVGGSETTSGQTSTISSISNKKQDGQPSSSDNETAQDSLDARIKARRKRLQKSKAMLQEHKEDGWNYRRTLQIEESKQRQQTSAAATISYSRNAGPETIKRDQEQMKPEASPTKFTAVDEVAERKPTPRIQKGDHIEPSPRATPSRSTVPSSFDENASGVRVQKIYLHPLKSNFISDPATASQSDHDGDESVSPMHSQSKLQSQTVQNEPKPQRQTNTISKSPVPTAVNAGVKKLIEQEKSDVNTTYRRSTSMHRSSPMSNRGISNERTPPPPISQRQDFNYNQYVISIAPKQVSYENPAAALVEADQQQQLEDLPKSQDTKRPNVTDGPKQTVTVVKEEATNSSQKSTVDKGGDVKINNSPPDHTKITVKTKPIRSQPPSVVVVTAVSPPSAKRNVNNVSQASPPVTAPAKASSETVPLNSLNNIPTPFRRTSASPARTTVEDKPLAKLTPSLSKEKLASKSPEVKRRQAPLPPVETTDDDERKRHSSAQKKKAAEPNYAVVNGDSKPTRTPTPDPSTSTVVVPLPMIPAKSVPEKITPTFTPTFTQPSPSQLQQVSPAGHGMTGKETREAIVPQTSILHEPIRSRAPTSDHEPTPLLVPTNQRSIAVATAKEADGKLRLELKKHQRREDLRKETAAEMHRLPSVDREMLNLLTLGEELNNSRSSISTFNSQTAGLASTQAASQQSKFAHSFRTAMPQKGTTNPPVHPGRDRQKRISDMSGQGSIQGSRESLNSFNLVPKPWRPSLQGSREGSSESLASSFATATSTGNLMRGSKDSLNIQSAGPYKDALLNVYPKPWSSKLGRDRLSISAEPLATVAETPGESVPAVPPRSHDPHSQRHTNSLDLATRKVDEMLRLAKLKHQQQQRREKIVLLQSQAQHPQSLTVITTNPVISDEKSHNPITDASRELDKAYEAIQLDYAEAQESRQRHHRKNQMRGAISDNENVFVRPQLVTVFSTVHMPSPRRAESGDETARRRAQYREDAGVRMTEKEQAYSRRTKRTAQTTMESTPGGGPYDNSKLDYTKRWLEGDLKSLTRDTKPDLLQFGSAPKLDFDQRSVGSASAEVAAITNKERLQAMREVPDLVPQQQHQHKHQQQQHQNHQYLQHQHQPHSKPQLVKPSPVVAVNARNQAPPNHGNGHMLAPILIGNFLGPRIGQPGSKSSSFAGGLPSLQSNAVGNSRPGQHPGQRHQPPPPSHQPPPPQLPINYNSGGIRLAGDQLRSSVESLPHSDRSWALPKNVCGQGLVRKQVDMFDRMSDNDSELSFRSADNVAYRSALYKPSRRLSLTDHMSNFVRRFESDEESNGSRGSGFYRWALPQKQPHADLHSDDEVRLAAMRNGSYFKRPLAHFQHMQANGGGSTQSLPVALPYHHAQKMPNGNLRPAQGHFQQAAPHFFGPQQGPARNISQMGSQSQEQITPQQQHRKIIPPWLRQPNRTASPKQQYWSSNSTLTDLEAPGVSQYYPSRNTKHMHPSTDTMHAVDSLVAELELNTDASGSVISQRSTNNFPVDRFYYHNSYPQPEVDRSSSRSKLNVILEQAEQQQHQLDTLHLAQRKLEEARKDLRNVSAAGTRRQMGKEKPHWLLAAQDSLTSTTSAQRFDQDKPTSQRHYTAARPNEPSNASLPRSLSGEKKHAAFNPHQQHHPQAESQTVVKYRQNKSVVGRPASYAAPGVMTVPRPSGHSFMPSGSAEHIERKYSAGNEKEEDNYDNVVIGRWQRDQSQRSKVPEPPRSAVPPANLHSPNKIKIGSVVLGRGDTPTNDQQHDQMTQSRIDRQQQGTKNPLKNFFQLFTKNGNGGKAANGDTAANESPFHQMQDSQRSYHEASSSSQKAPSSLSLNVGPSPTNSSARNSANMSGSMIASSDGNHFRKSCSTNDAYTLKPIITPQEMRQLDELLTSFHEDGTSTSGNEQKKSGSLRSKTGVDPAAISGVKQDQAKQMKTTDKANNNNNNNAVQDQRTPSRFKLGLPAFWKRA